MDPRSAVGVVYGVDKETDPEMYELRLAEMARAPRHTTWPRCTAPSTSSTRPTPRLSPRRAEATTTAPARAVLVNTCSHLADELLSRVLTTES